MSHPSRLPNPYQPEGPTVDARLASLQNALDWAQVVQMATPWVQAVRDNPPPFWAMESLLKEPPSPSLPINWAGPTLTRPVTR